MKKMLTLSLIMAAAAAGVMWSDAARAGNTVAFEGIEIEAPDGWEIAPIPGSISIYPPEEISPSRQGISLSVSRLPEGSPEDLSAIWAHMESNFKKLGKDDTRVIEQKEGTLAGRPAKIVVYTEQELGLDERSKVYSVYAQIYEGSPVFVVRYSGTLSAYDRFWSEASKAIGSVNAT